MEKRIKRSHIQLACIQRERTEKERSNIQWDNEWELSRTEERNDYTKQR